jgi:replicative DNA helicase
MATERLVPQNLEAEQCVLGSILLDSACRGDVQTILGNTGRMFFGEVHGKLYECLLAVSCPDYITVVDELRVRGLSEVIKASEVAKLLNVVPTAVHAAHYARIVSETYYLRQMYALGPDIQKLIFEPADGARAVFERVRGLVEAIQPPTGEQNVLTWKDSFEWYLNVILKRVADHDAGIEHLTLPWDAFKGVGPLDPGTTIIVAASSGAGKTAFAECCAEDWARKGFNTLFFHLELSHQTMLDRRCTRHTGISKTKLVTDPDLGDIARQLERLRGWPGKITFIYCPAWTAGQIAQCARQLAQQERVDAIVVDYIGMVAFDTVNPFHLNSAQQRGQQLATLKDCGSQLGAPVMVLSQFNREVRTLKWRKSDALRDSGEYQERSNVVITLDRPVLENDLFESVAGQKRLVAHAGEYDPVAKVVIEKNTTGAPYATRMEFVGKRISWYDATDLEPPEEEM